MTFEQHNQSVVFVHSSPLRCLKRTAQRLSEESCTALLLARAMRSHVGRTTPAVAVAWSSKTSRQSILRILPVLLLLSVLESKSVPVTTSTQSEIRCVTAWGNGDGDHMVLLPSDKINDGYCDCLDSGADEPQTSACSGMFQWAGLFAATTNDIQRKHT
jgi:hypothetical protein